MSVTRGHNIIKILPTPATIENPHKKIYLHLDEPYDPPTFVNNVLYQCVNRPNAQTPSAFTWHLRYGCKCASVLKHTKQHVEGLTIRQGTFQDLEKLLPCSGCLAGKARKFKKQPTKNFTEAANLNTTLATDSTSPRTTTSRAFPPNPDIAKIVRVPEQSGYDYILWADYTGCCTPGEYDVDLDAFVTISVPYPRKHKPLTNAT